MMEQILNLLVTPAYADAGSASGPQGSMSVVIMFAVLFLFMYFAIWRPQNKRMREQADMMASLAKGDEVATVGGVLGRITRMNNQFITLAIASDVEVYLQKSSVVSVLPKGTIKSIE